MHILYGGLRYENDHFSFKNKSTCARGICLMKSATKVYATRCGETIVPQP